MQDVFLLASVCLGLPLLTAVSQGQIAPAHNDNTEVNIEADYEEEENDSYTTKQIDEAKSELKKLSQQYLELIRGVTDTASANATAPHIAACNESMHRIMERVSKNMRLMAFDIFSDYEEQDTQHEIKRLKSQHFFGSEPLAIELTDCAAFAHPAIPLSAELRAQFSKLDGEPDKLPPTIQLREIENSDGRYKLTLVETNIENLPKLSGGPGFTQQTAWVLEASENEEMMNRPMYYYAVFLSAKCDEDTIYSEGYYFNEAEAEIVFADGKVYCHRIMDILPEEDKGGRYVLEHWLDITAYTIFRTQEEMQQFAEEGAQFLAEHTKLLLTATDKASADAAADALTAMASQITPKHKAAVDMLGTEQKFAMVRRHGVNPGRHSWIMQSLIAHHFHGSQKLQKAVLMLQSIFETL